MTNEELKIKLDEFLSKNKLSGITLANLNLIIKISELYLDLKEELADIKFSSVDLENYKRLDLFTKIDLVKKIFKKYNYPISNETIDKILSDGTIDFREYEYDKDYLPSVHEGIVAGCAGIKDDFRFISIPNSGYITDAVIFAHELAHYTVGIPENTTDHMVSESLAIFTEFLMEDELSSMGYNEEMKYVRKLRFKDTLNKKIKKEISKVEVSDNKKYITATFGEQKVDYDKEVFEGVTINAVFGGVKLDLRNAKIKEDVVVNTTSIFGGVDIYLPEKVNVKVVSSNIFGGVDNKVKNEISDKQKTIYINSTNIFGGTDIK